MGVRLCGQHEVVVTFRQSIPRLNLSDGARAGRTYIACEHVSNRREL